MKQDSKRLSNLLKLDGNDSNVFLTPTGRKDEEQWSRGDLGIRSLFREQGGFYRRPGLSEGILVCLGCQDKVPQTGWFKQEKFIFS